MNAPAVPAETLATLAKRIKAPISNVSVPSARALPTPSPSARYSAMQISRRRTAGGSGGRTERAVCGKADRG